MIVPVLLGWLVGVALAIWWPRSSRDNQARERAYSFLKRAASCHLLGFVCWVILMLAGIDIGDHMLLFLLLLIAAGLGALSLTPFALSMLGLDLGSRAVGVAGSALATLFPAGLTCYALLILLGIYAGAAPWWMGVPALGTVLLCGVATWFVLEAYAVMRSPRRRAGGSAE